VVSVDNGSNSPDPMGNDPTNADFEVALDIEVAGAIAPDAVLVVYFAPNTEQSFLDAATQAIHDTTHGPSVISISWGSPESVFTPQFMNQMDQAFQDAAVLGVTICAASGDNGSTDGQSDNLLHVDFPASSPHVLGCGGTTIIVQNDAITSEVVWNTLLGATGGGISDQFPVPSWQLDQNIPASGNPRGRIGRGVPDVSGDADADTGYAITVHDMEWHSGGTSAVAPLWAALIALINQELAQAVPNLDQSVGFVNPWIYGLPPGSIAFRDVTTGNNDTASANPPRSYIAGTGWDACTGLGSPNGSGLLWSLTHALAGFHIKIRRDVDECGRGGVVGGMERFRVSVLGAPPEVSPTYSWSVSGLGASIVPPSTSWAVTVQYGPTADPITVRVDVTVGSITRKDSLTCRPETARILAFKDLLCRIRSEVQFNFSVDPLWDPLRDYVTHPYTHVELVRLQAVATSLASLAREALTLEGEHLAGEFRALTSPPAASQKDIAQQ
jgi:hypothetical protein